MKIEQWQIDKITPYENNPRFNDDAVDKVAMSIQQYGWQQPIVVDSDGVVIVGHTRLKAAEKIGLDKCPVVVADNLTDAQVKAYRIADNKTGEIATWDEELLNSEIQGLVDLDFNIELTGFEIDDFDFLEEEETGGLTDADAVPEVPEEPTSKLGDLWILGEHRLLCGDSTKVEDVERLMDGQKADMVFTDPPYGVAYAEKAERNGRKQRSKIKNDENINAMSEIVLPAFQRVSENIKDGAGYYICSPQGGDQEMMMMMMMREAGIKCRHQLIWKKDSAVFSMGRLDYDYMHEPMLYGWKKSHQFYGKNKKSIWEFDRPKASKLHPTMKPVELIEEAIKNSSKGGDLVIDFFLGSGSTLIACEKTNRKCYGMELDPHYCDVIIRRWEEYTGGKAVLTS